MGRLSYEKGILTLIKAFQLSPRHKLKVAGEGKLRNEIVNYIKRYNISNVTYIGYVDTSKTVNIFDDISFTIIPSECYENNPLIGIESLSNGVPIIGSNIGGIPELAMEGKTGFLFKISGLHF